MATKIEGGQALKVLSHCTVEVEIQSPLLCGKRWANPNSLVSDAEHIAAEIRRRVDNVSMVHVVRHYVCEFCRSEWETSCCDEALAEAIAARPKEDKP